MPTKIDWPFAKESLRNLTALFINDLDGWRLIHSQYGVMGMIYDDAKWPDVDKRYQITIDANGDAWHEVPFSCDDRDEAITQEWIDSLPGFAVSRNPAWWEVLFSSRNVHLEGIPISVCSLSITKAGYVNLAYSDMSFDGDDMVVRLSTRGQLYDLLKALGVAGPWL